jgi:hypothetical protein
VTTPGCLVVAAATLLGCSVWYGGLPVGQCSVDLDCEALGLGDVCDPSERVCVSRSLEPSPSAALANGCRGVAGPSTSDCAEEGCAVPLSNDCTCLEGAWDDPSALVVGVIAPLTFGNEAEQTLTLPYVERWQKSLGLGLEEWTREVPDGGLPRSGRPLALLHCNSNDELFRARRAMTHLTEVATAPVVITLTDNDTDAIRDQSLRSGVPVICASCFSAQPEAPGEASLIWPIAPALIRQAPLAAARVLELAAQTSDGAEPPRLVTLSQNYPGINEFAAEVDRLVDAGGSFEHFRIQTPNPHLQSFTQLDVIRSVIDARPDVVTVGMDSDFTTYYLRRIEADWPKEYPRPQYVLSYLNQELGLVAEVVGDGDGDGDDGLRRRISGVGWWPGSDVSHNLSGLEERFQARHRERVEQTQFGYDAWYAAAYGIAWADLRGAPDGPGAALGLEHLRQGPPVNVGPANVRAALVQLLSAGDIDLIGSSNRLDFQASTHATDSDVTVWCLVRSSDTSLGLLASAGPVWHADTGEVTGQYSCP